MKLNKFKTIVPAAALLLSASLCSCMDDLDKGNIDPNGDANANIIGLYSKCYAGLIMEGNDGNADFKVDDNGKSTLIRNLYYFNELPTDESICWWSDGGIIKTCYNEFAPDNDYLKILYYRMMNNISYENHFLGLEAAKEDKAKYAEVRVIRAYQYLLMLDFWGDPSFSDKISEETPRQAHTYNEKYDASKSYTRAQLLQMGREFLFNWVKSELLAAEPDLLEAKPETDTDPDYGRVDKGTCWLLLSRLYLNAGTYLNNNGQDNPYWDKALEYAKKVIDSPYKLFLGTDMTAEAKANGYKPYDLLFMGDNGSNGASCEALLPLMQDGNDTQGYGGSLFFIATSIDAQSRTVTGKAMGTTELNWSGMRVRPSFLKKFINNPTEFEGKTAAEIRGIAKDDRALFWGEKAGKADEEPEMHTVDLGKNAAFKNGLNVVKWNNQYSTGANSHDTKFVDTDFFLFRVAEAYLNAAEAALHLNDANSAKKWIDALRDRANAELRSSYTLEDVLDERARELYCEGLRRTDLIRYNQFGGAQATYNWEYKAGSKNGTTFDKKFNVYPLPSSELLSNDNLIQIDGYNEVQN